MDKMDRTARLSVKKETPTLTPNEGDRPSGKPTSFQLRQNISNKRSTVPEITLKETVTKESKDSYYHVEIRDEDEVDKPSTSGMPSDLPTSKATISVIREEESPQTYKSSKLCINEGRPPKSRQRRHELFISSSINVSYNKQELNHSAMICNSSSDCMGIYFHEKKLKFSFESDIRMGMLEAEARLKAGDFRKTEIYQGRATGIKFYIKQNVILDGKTDSVVSKVHCNVVQIMALYARPGGHFDIWMKYSGVDLLAFMMEFDNQQFTDDAILKVGVQGHSALKFFHSRGLRHRQITPKDILVTDNKRTGLVMKISNVCQEECTSPVFEYISPETVLHLLQPNIKPSFRVNYFELALVLLLMYVRRPVLRQISVAETSLAEISVSSKPKVSFAQTVIKKFLESPDYVTEECIPDGISKDLENVLKDFLHLTLNVKDSLKEIIRDPRKAFAENNPKIPTTVFDCDHRNEWHALKENPSSSVRFSIIPGLNPELEALKGVERQVKSDQLAYKKEIPRKRKAPSDEQLNERKKPKTCETYAAEQFGERKKPATIKTYAAEQPGERKKPGTSKTYAAEQPGESKKSTTSKTHAAEQPGERKKPGTSKTYAAEQPGERKKPGTSKTYAAEQPGERKKPGTSKTYAAEQPGERKKPATIKTYAAEQPGERKKPGTSKTYAAEQPGERKKPATIKTYAAEQPGERKKPGTSKTYAAEQPGERKKPGTSKTYAAEQPGERKKPGTSKTYAAEQPGERKKPGTSMTYTAEQPGERKKPGTSMTYTAEHLSVGNFPKASKTSTNGKKPRRKRCILNRPTINPNELSKVSIMIKNSLKQKISTSLNSIPESIEVADKSSPSVDEESANTGLNIPLFDKLNIDC